VSIAAVNWAFAQRGLKPASKLILVYLADCHNRETRRCDPSQAALAEECCMSRASVNTHLKLLEEMGLIRRIQRTDKSTKQQERTLYILGLDGDDLAEQTEAKKPEAVSKNWTRKSGNPVSRKREIPCPEKRDSRVQTSGHEPEENRKEPECAGETPDEKKARGVCEFWAERVKSGLPVTPSAISIRTAHGMLARGLVSNAELKAHGVTF
jgi:DNA-binding MarR family transcriptional regulator